MKAIVCILPKPKGIFSRLRLIFSPPAACRKTTIGTETIPIYTLNPLWKLRFPKLVSNLEKKHAVLLFDESVKQYPKLYREPSRTELFFQNFPQIISCHCGGEFIKPAILCKKPDERLMPLLSVLSRHAKAVTLCTADSDWFETISSEALRQWGLSLNQREPEAINEAELAVILSMEDIRFSIQTPVISLTKETPAMRNCLLDYSDKNVSDFFVRFPHLHLNHCYLVPQNGKIRNLIWKIQKKS